MSSLIAGRKCSCASIGDADCLLYGEEPQVKAVHRIAGGFGRRKPF